MIGSRRGNGYQSRMACSGKAREGILPVVDFYRGLIYVHWYRTMLRVAGIYDIWSSVVAKA